MEDLVLICQNLEVNEMLRSSHYKIIWKEIYAKLAFLPCIIGRGKILGIPKWGMMLFILLSHKHRIQPKSGRN